MNFHASMPTITTDQPLELLLLSSVAEALGVPDSPVVPGGLAPWQVKRVIRFIVENAARSTTVADLAAVARLSVSHFSRAFRRSFGATPHSVVARHRVERAKALLASTNQPIAAIALDCGFADQSHLTRLFRRQVDLAPGQWRELSRTGQ